MNSTRSESVLEIFKSNKKIKTNRIINPILNDISQIKYRMKASNRCTDKNLWTTPITKEKLEDVQSTYIKEELNIDWDENDNIEDLSQEQAGITGCPEETKNGVDNLGRFRCNYCDRKSKRVYGKRIIKCEKCQVPLEFVCQRCFRKKKIDSCEHSVSM